MDGEQIKKKNKHKQRLVTMSLTTSYLTFFIEIIYLLYLGETGRTNCQKARILLFYHVCVGNNLHCIYGEHIKVEILEQK